MQIENRIRAWIHGQPGLVVSYSPQAVMAEAPLEAVNAIGVAPSLAQVEKKARAGAAAQNLIGDPQAMCVRMAPGEGAADDYKAGLLGMGTVHQLHPAAFVGAQRSKVGFVRRLSLPTFPVAFG